MLTERIDALVAEAEEQRRQKPGHYEGFDWWQLSDEEQIVFAIDPERWPRMAMTISAYDVFLDLTGGDMLGHDEDEMARLRSERRDLFEMGFDPKGFAQFATTYAGLTLREAAAAYWKNQFWLARTGVLKYRDEPGWDAE